jgi:hypothetical protein
MYRDDLEATHARANALQNELDSAKAKGARDDARIAQLTAQLTAMRQALSRVGAQAPRQPHYMFLPRGGTIMALGICSLVLCSLLGPVAWAMGNEELRRISLGQTSAESHSQAAAGRVCGIVATAFLGVAVLFVVFFLSTASHHRW